MDAKAYSAEEVAYQLVADKIFANYLEMCHYFGGLEPEEFVDNHIRKNFIQTNSKMDKAVWKHFMENLLAYRKGHRKERQ